MNFMKINDNSENLEKALNKEPVKISKEDNLNGIPQRAQESQGGTRPATQASEIGYHKGSLNTLINERNELIKMIQMVESIMQAHIQRLEELGVKISKKE